MEAARSNTGAFALIAALCLVACTGCGSGQTCTAEMTEAGQTYKGSSGYAEQAIENTCANYCAATTSGHQAATCAVECMQQYRDGERLIWVECP